MGKKCEDKAKYATERDALTDLARIQSRPANHKMPSRAYRCECGLWHLTSTSPYDQPLRDKIKELEMTIERLKQKWDQRLKTNRCVKKELNSVRQDMSKVIARNQELEMEIKQLKEVK